MPALTIPSMTQQLFESRVLEMWMTTRIPLTRANVQYFTKAPRKQMERWLDAMVAEGVVEVDADDEGEMIWAVRGAVRPTTGATSVEELGKLESLQKDADELRGAARSLGALVKVGSGQGLTTRGLAGKLGHKEGEKSVVASGLLSLVFGPLGWLYAAPLKEAVPAIVLYMLLLWLPLVHLLFIPLLPLVHIAAGAAGALYAWKHNQKGERTPIAESVRRALPGGKK